MMSETQTQALATLVTRLRPDWDHVGLVSVICKARHMGTPIQISRALLVLAENRELRTPALLAQKGHHWHQDGQPVGPNASANMHCHRHPLSVIPCPQCASQRTMPDQDYLAAKDALRSSRSRAVERAHQEATP